MVSLPSAHTCPSISEALGNVNQVCAAISLFSEITPRPKLNHTTLAHWCRGDPCDRPRGGAAWVGYGAARVSKRRALRSLTVAARIHTVASPITCCPTGLRVAAG